MTERPRLETGDDGVVAVSGALEFGTVAGLADAELPQQGKLVIDLGGVAHADSAGLALLVHWLRLARVRDQELEFRRIPDQLMDMIRLSGLEDILPHKGG